MHQLLSHRKDFYESLYFSIFLKSAKEIEVSLKSDKKMGNLNEDLYVLFIYDIISLCYLESMSTGISYMK